MSPRNLCGIVSPLADSLSLYAKNHIRRLGLTHAVCILLVSPKAGHSESPKKHKKRLPLSGYFNNGSANNQGSNGNWWSSTRNNNNNMYNLNANTSNINPANNNNRNNGNSVRCVLGS